SRWVSAQKLADFGPGARHPKPTNPTPGGPTVDNENETLITRALVIALIVFGIFRIVGDFQNLYEQTELKGQELSRWSKQ
ncbi:hypothetical protein JTL63_35035, partial [Pseudomonas aeruginosa]|nr:hypothetical protein [Pseudomonas aeruginosa]